jgi:hypothetical protein
MDDMGHGSHAMAPGEMACGANMDHSTMSMPMPATDANASGQRDRQSLVDMQTMSPAPRLDDPGIGLRDNGRRVLALCGPAQPVRRCPEDGANPRARSSCT